MTEKILELDNINIKIELGKSLINILYVRFASPERIKYIGNHSHSSYELHFIPYGHGQLITNGKIYNITPGTLYLTGPNVYHEQKGDESDPMAEYCVNFEILENHNYKPGKQGVYKGQDLNLIEQTLSKTVFWFGQDNHDNIHLFEKLLEEVNSKQIGYYFNIQNYISIILTNTVRSYSNNLLSCDPPPVKDINDRRRLLADQYIEKGWTTKSVDDLAQKLRVSRRQLNRIFIKYYGVSFNQKLTQVRMENAIKLLMETSQPIKEIAEQVGYDDFGYFCRTFKKSYSMTALEYRHANSSKATAAFSHKDV